MAAVITTVTEKKLITGVGDVQVTEIVASGDAFLREIRIYDTVQGSNPVFVIQLQGDTADLIKVSPPTIPAF